MSNHSIFPEQPTPSSTDSDWNLWFAADGVSEDYIINRDQPAEQQTSLPPHPKQHATDGPEP